MGGVETDGGDGNETGPVMKKGKQKFMTGIGASLTLDNRDKEESNIKKCTIDIFHHRFSSHISKIQ